MKTIISVILTILIVISNGFAIASQSIYNDSQKEITVAEEQHKLKLNNRNRIELESERERIRKHMKVETDPTITKAPRNIDYPEKNKAEEILKKSLGEAFIKNKEQLSSSKRKEFKQQDDRRSELLRMLHIHTEMITDRTVMP